MRLKASGLFQLALLILSVVMFVTATTYNVRARLMPEILAVAMFALVLLMFLSENVPAAGRYLGFMKQKGYFTNQGVNKEKETESEDSATENWKVLHILLWLVGFVVMLKFVSYLITIPVWLLFFSRFMGGRSWRSSIGAAVGMGIFDYVLFAVLLNSTF